MNINEIKIYYNNFFKDFFNNSILIKKMKRIQFLNLRYKEKNFNFSNEKLEKRKSYYSLDKHKNK